MRDPLVNIIIVTWKQFEYIYECIESVLNCGYPNIKIYLVDNNSKRSDYEELYKRYRLIKNIIFFRKKSNTGFAGGCNYALPHIKKGYIIFLNDDVIVTKNWLKPIIEYMGRNPEVGACQPKIRDMKQPEYFEYAGAAGGFMDVYGYPFCRGRIFFTREKDEGQYNDIVDLVWTSGSCMVTKAEVIKKIGVFDESFFMYGEEADLCWRMNFAGYRLVSIPSSIVYHYGSASMKKFQSHKKVFFHHRNGLILLFKNYTLRELFRYFPIRIFLDFVGFWYYFFNAPSNSFALITGYIHFLYSLPQLLRKRTHAPFKSAMKKRPVYPLYKDSIIIDYFLLKRKKFKQLPFVYKQN